MNWDLLGVGGSIFVLLAVIFILLMTVARYYKKVSPNTVAIVTGRRHKHRVGGAEVERGYRYVIGGGFFLVPVVEKMEKPIPAQRRQRHLYLQGREAMADPRTQARRLRCDGYEGRTRRCQSLARQDGARAHRDLRIEGRDWTFR